MKRLGSNPLCLAALAVVLLGIQPAAFAKSKCFPREGHCIAAVVNGQKAVPLNKATKKALRQLEEASHYVDDALYEVPEPIRGALEVEATMVAGSQSWFGDGAGSEVQVVPLDDVDLATTQRLVAEPTVRIGGRAAVGVGNFLEDDRLPPGRYLIRVRVRGPENWDRQTIFVTVAE